MLKKTEQGALSVLRPAGPQRGADADPVFDRQAVSYPVSCKRYEKKGYDNKSIASKAGIPPFTVGKYAAQASKFRTVQLRLAMEECAAADEAVKTGRMNDKMSVELLIVKYSS